MRTSLIAIREESIARALVSDRIKDRVQAHDPNGPTEKAPRRTIVALLGMALMRVKLCARCPYMPQDLADHYDAGAALHLCARCDGESVTAGIHPGRVAQWREECAIAPNALSAVRQQQQEAALSVVGGLA